MKPITVTNYEAFDGKMFDSWYACKEYENEQTERLLKENGIIQHFGKMYDPYFLYMHTFTSKEDVEKVISLLIDIDILHDEKEFRACINLFCPEFPCSVGFVLDEDGYLESLHDLTNMYQELTELQAEVTETLDVLMKGDTES